MKIYDTNLTGAAGSGRAQDTQRIGPEGGSKSSAAGSQAGDRIDFSNKLNSVSRALSADSAGRAAKLQTLTAQYRSGTYQVNSKAIGRGMIKEALAQQGR